MAYVITAARLGLEGPGHRIIESRRAVATLKGREVWNALYGVEIPGREEIVEQIAALPESGGTVGPLPDGTVVEVAPVEMDELAHWAGFITVPGTWAEADAQRIFDAFNAQGAQGAA